MESVSAFRKESNLSSRQTDLAPVFITPLPIPEALESNHPQIPCHSPKRVLEVRELSFRETEITAGPSLDVLLNPILNCFQQFVISLPGP